MLRKYTLTILAALCLLATDLAAQTSSRLRATHTIRFDTSWQPNDSTTLVYSNGNGGDYWDLLNRRLKYDTTFTLAWDGSAYIPYMHTIQTFNAQNRVTERLYVNVMGASPVNDKRTVYTYDNNGNVVEQLEQDWVNNGWENTFREVRTFDANNNLILSNSEYWNTAANNWGSSYLSVYAYSTNNNLISRVLASRNTPSAPYDSSSRSTNHFNANNQVDTNVLYLWNNGWVKSSRTISIYNTAGTSYDYVIENWDAIANAWTNNLRGFTLYDASNNDYGDSTQRWDANTSAWVNFSRSLNTMDANNDRVEYLYQQFDTLTGTFINNYVDSYAYNNFHQVTWAKRQTWDTLTDTWTGGYANTDNHYYYELFTADVNSIAREAGVLTVYPVPTNSMLHIDMKWNKSQDFIVAIFDMQGRLVKQWGQQAAKEYKTSISVRDLAPGNYVIQVRGSEGKTQQQFIVF